MTAIQWIALLSLFGWGYCALLAAVLLILFCKERSAFYRLLLGTSHQKGDRHTVKPLGDRIGELQKKWREPRHKDGKGDER